MQQFGRVYQLIIGNDKESIIISKLTISFDITKTITQEPNPATFTVVGLNPSTRNLITDKKYNRLMFKAGYQDDLKTLFIGYIDEVENIRDGVETTTRLVCSDGQQDYRESYTAVTVQKGATDKDIVAQVLKDMPNTEKGNQTYKNERRLPRGKTMVGNSRDIIKKVASNQDADWSIQDGRFLLLPKSHALKNNEGFLISEQTGMIGSPQKTSDGLEVECQLNNVMRVGQLCRIESMFKEKSGDFKIMKIQMMGSTKGNDWKSKLTVQGGQYIPVEKDESKK